MEQYWHRVPGGTATSMHGTLLALRDHPELELIGVSARHGGPPDALAPPIPVKELALPRLALYESWHVLRWPKVEQATGPLDVVHATAVAVPPTSAPLVMTIHDLAFLADPTQATRHGNRFFRRGTELARRHAQLVLVPSQATADECVAAGFDPERIRIVPWGVDSRVATADEIAATRTRFNLERPYVLFVGTVEPRKNLGALVAAMRALEGQQTDLVLVGPDGWNEDLDSRLKVLEGSGIGVHRLGYQSADTLASLYGGATVFCFPSLREGFGMPVLEAMAQGTPVVTSSGTATAEVGHGAAILVDPTDHTSLGEALYSVVTDSQLAAELAAKATQRAALYPWSRTAELTAAAYHEVLQ